METADSVLRMLIAERARVFSQYQAAMDELMSTWIDSESRKLRFVTGWITKLLHMIDDDCQRLAKLDRSIALRQRALPIPVTSAEHIPEPGVPLSWDDIEPATHVVQ